MMAEFSRVVSRLQRHRGVVGVMLVGIDDGMVILGDAGVGRDADTTAALAASLFRRSRTAAAEAGLGSAMFVRLEADRGNVCAVARDEVVIVAMATAGTNLGKLRLEMINAMEMI